MSERSLKSLTIALKIGGIWDAFMGFSFILVIGTGRLIDQPPPLDLFYAVFLGSFFLCFAYLQLFSAQNVRRYSFILGCIIFGRMFYVIQLSHRYSNRCGLCIFCYARGIKFSGSFPAAARLINWGQFTYYLINFTKGREIYTFHDVSQPI
jgi:hypothetical protein